MVRLVLQIAGRDIVIQVRHCGGSLLKFLEGREMINSSDSFSQLSLVGLQQPRLARIALFGCRSYSYSMD